MTPAEVNALPENVRNYIHLLIANCDPAGNVAQNVLVMDQNKQLAVKLEEIKTALSALLLHPLMRGVYVECFDSPTPGSLWVALGKVFAAAGVATT